MHPVLARFLNLATAAQVLSNENDPGLTADDRAFLEVAADAPERKAQVLGASRHARPPPEVQETLVYLAAHAAARALAHDDRLKAALDQARKALVSEGANEDDVRQFLASMVLEEAFGYEHDADEFDVPFFEETLKSVPELARLSQERVKQLVLMFVKSGEAKDRPIYGVAAQSLIETAWEDGPEPINPEHVESAIATAREKIKDKEAPQLIDGMRKFVAFLARSGLVGPLRQAELTRAVESAALDVPGAEGVKN